MVRSRTLNSYLATFALIVTLPLMTAALIATYRFAESERARLETQANDLNSELVLLIDRELSVRAAMLEAFAAAFANDNGDIDHMEGELRAHSIKSGAHMLLLDTSGQQLVNTSLPKGSRLPMVSDPQIVREVIRTGKVYVSNLFKTSTSRRFLVQVAVPVMQAGKLTAILSSAISSDRLVELLRQGLPKGPYFATIVDRAGIIVARSTQPEKFVGAPFPKLANLVEGSRGSFSLVNPEGVPIFGYFRKTPISQWVVAAAIQRTALTAPLARSLEALALVAAALVALSVSGAWTISRTLRRAHGSLMTAAGVLGRGEPVSPIATELQEANVVGDALSAASMSIREQAAALTRSNQELEDRVSMRTRDLAEQTALLQTTLDTISRGVMVIDGRSRVALTNRRAREMLDLPRSLLEPAPSLEAVVSYLTAHGEFAASPQNAEHLFRDLRESGLSHFEHQRPDGTRLDVDTVPVRGGEGYLRTFADVTEQYRQARELRHAKEAAEAASHAKDAFLATMSHEMRTPLNAVIGFSDQLMRDTSLTAEARQSGQRIQSAGAALLSLVDDILDLGKIEAGIIDVRTEAFRLRDLVGDAEAMVRPMADEKGLVLRVLPSRKLEEFYVGDRYRLRQVLVNLLNNAVKFTPSGSVRVSIKECDVREGMPVLRFSVTDTGIGIAEKDQGELFQRFHQLDPAFNRRFGGAGLGLAICRQLVERMGGAINVESEPGKGSTFWFEVPLAAAEDAGEPHANGAPTISPARILVAEDIVLNQELARELLEEKGHSVDVVSNGLEALEAAVGGTYDVILMDVSMPVMDGLTATKLIRNTSSAVSRTPIVACTANALPARVSELRDAGADAYLRKPLRRSELHGTIARVLAKNSQQDDDLPPANPDHTLPDNVWSIISLLGPKRVMAALDDLTEELKRLTLADPADFIECRLLAERAHAVISTASMLELTELAESCRDLENACREAHGVAGAMDRLAPVISSALEASARLRVDLARHVS